MMKSKWSTFLTASRFSRAVYGVSKVVAFILLGLILAFQKAYQSGMELLPAHQFQLLVTETQVIVWIMVAFNLIRGIPVLIDGRFYLFDKYLPRSLKGDA